MKKIKRRNIELKPTESSVAPIGSAKEKILPERETLGTERATMNRRSQFVL